MAVFFGGSTFSFYLLRLGKNHAFSRAWLSLSFLARIADFFTLLHNMVLRLLKDPVFKCLGGPSLCRK